jgi:tRNA C32,U32 (ribose-2'-O)-methylase TrmJ
MMPNWNVRPDVDQVLAGLKDFQRDTVGYVFQRLYQDPDRVSRFLIADEVGLGKTLVARGIIAKAVDYLWEKIDRIDIVYICSNQEIARQNIDRLDITADRTFQFSSRATLLPVTLQELKGNKLNFVSFTPATSFHLRSKSGIKTERALLYYLLREAWDVHESTLRNVMRGPVQKKRWRRHLEWFEREMSVDEELAEAFHAALAEEPALRSQYETLAKEIGSRRRRIPQALRRERNRLIGNLRRLLARTSLSALEPDLVILDEFQRFKYLLEEESDLALLARELFNFPDVKVLLLSATPYKMYTLQWEQDENHYADFLRTVKFLLQEQPEALAELGTAIDGYRRAIVRLDSGGLDELQSTKATIERILRKVMVRTERLAASADRNGMLVEVLAAQDKIQPADLQAFVHLDRITQALNAGDPVEYWKSSAYPLNLMEDYKLKRRFEDALRGPESRELSTLLAEAQPHLLSWSSIQAYQALDPGNARLRALFEDTLETHNWQLLWIPASLPYYQPTGPFAEVRPEGCTKTLVFSAWRVVPKMIALLTSYEAERRMLGDAQQNFRYSELTRKRKPLLRFARSKGRLVGMPLFCLIYPCLTLAELIDPLAISRALANGGVPSAQSLFKATRERISQLFEEATAFTLESDVGQVDEAWYWMALVLLDQHFNPEAVTHWLLAQKGSSTWPRLSESDSDDQDASRFAEHLREFTTAFRVPRPMGRRPADLLDVLTRIALASPAVATLRALLRKTPPQDMGDLPALLASAAKAGLTFQTLFNHPEVITLLQRLYRRDAYWKKVLRYCVDGNLQAVLDEYFHVLYESLGLVGHDPVESAEKMADALAKSLSLRSPTLRFDEVVLTDEDAPIALKKRGIRCRYALRFGDDKSEDYNGRTRDVDVRTAFNSPFRPFVLATTSIGQEGLDFHQYCHRVVHWNLPSNPVDLEQREGRVHRYKGHVVRRNLALSYGLSAVEPTQGQLVDPWQQLFDRAVEDRSPGTSDLEPFWVCKVDNGFSIERKVPVLPLSRELIHMQRLKRSLVAYRSVIGQPRQQELLEFLSDHLSVEELQKLVGELAIDLSPPSVRNSSVQ